MLFTKRAALTEPPTEPPTDPSTDPPTELSTAPSTAQQNDGTEFVAFADLLELVILDYASAVLNIFEFNVMINLFNFCLTVEPVKRGKAKRSSTAE